MHGGQTLDGAIIAVNFERDGSCFTRVTLSNILHVLTRSNNRYNASFPIAKPVRV